MKKINVIIAALFLTAAAAAQAADGKVLTSFNFVDDDVDSSYVKSVEVVNDGNAVKAVVRGVKQIRADVAAAISGDLERILVINGDKVEKDVTHNDTYKSINYFPIWETTAEMEDRLGDDFGNDDDEEQAPQVVEVKFCDSFVDDSKTLCEKADEQDRFGKSAVSAVMNYLRAAVAANTPDARRALKVKAASVASKRLDLDTFELALAAVCDGDKCETPAAVAVKPKAPEYVDNGLKQKTYADVVADFDFALKQAKKVAAANYAAVLAERARANANVSVALNSSN